MANGRTERSARLLDSSSRPSQKTWNGWLLGRMLKGEIRKMLFLATGALMSPTMSQQGESIPGVAHAVSLEVMP